MTRKKLASIDAEIEAIVENQGKLYTSAKLPYDIEWGEVGQCFDTCVMRALSSKGKYKYVEGLATAPDTLEWVLHAWLTDGVHAFDPTWSYYNAENDQRVRLPLPSAYVGIEMPIDKVFAFMMRTGNQGVIANRKLAPEMARPLIGDL